MKQYETMPNQNQKAVADNICLCPDGYPYDRDELDALFCSYVILGDEVIGMFKGVHRAILYTKF